MSDHGGGGDAPGRAASEAAARRAALPSSAQLRRAADAANPRPPDAVVRALEQNRLVLLCLREAAAQDRVADYLPLLRLLHADLAALVRLAGTSCDPLDALRAAAQSMPGVAAAMGDLDARK
jgi:hypothetical protein